MVQLYCFRLFAFVSMVSQVQNKWLNTAMIVVLSNVDCAIAAWSFCYLKGCTCIMTDVTKETIAVIKMSSL